MKKELVVVREVLNFVLGVLVVVVVVVLVEVVVLVVVVVTLGIDDDDGDNDDDDDDDDEFDIVPPPLLRIRTSGIRWTIVTNVVLFLCIGVDNG